MTFNEWLKQITDTMILKFARKEELTFEEVSFLVNGCYDKNIILKQDIQEKHGKVIIIKYIFFVPDLKKVYKYCPEYKTLHNMLRKKIYSYDKKD